MEYGFLFWVFLAGIVIATLQDLKRREVDNWLNLLILFSGIGFLAFKVIFNQDYSLVIFAIVSLLAMFLLSNMFYYARVFAGGDAKLLFALFALFVVSSFNGTLLNVGLFALFLMISGSVYGLIYSIVLFALNFKKVKRDFRKGFENIYLRYLVFAGIVLFVFSYINWFFLLPAIFLLLGPVLYVFAKSLEQGVMVREVSVKELRLGDWLAEDVKIGKKILKADWEGLTEKDLRLLAKLKKKVKVKAGLPFVPAFLIAFILYWFRDFFISLILRWI